MEDSIKSIKNFYQIQDSKALQEIHDDIKHNSYIDNEEINPLVLIHPKYRTVTWILIINMFLVGMNGLAFTAALKYITEPNNYTSNEYLAAALMVESLKFLLTAHLSRKLKDGKKNRKLALQSYASKMTFLNLLLLSVALIPLFLIKEEAGAG